VGTRVTRIAENEHTFRVLNEGVREVEERVGADPSAARFFCECARTDCSEVVVMSLDEYQSVRADSSCFLIRKGHEVGDVEDVVREEQHYAVVKKQRRQAP
jgi:hypothetical protein